MRVLITGSTDGIGNQTAKLLHSNGFDVVVHGKNPTKVEETAKLLKGEGIVVDLSSLKEIDNILRYVENKPIDILINNAGVYSKNYQLSKDNIELTFAVNYLAHFYLTLRLLQAKIFPKLILNISSMVHANFIDLDDLVKPHFYDAYEAYAVSKLCNILFTYYLANKVKDLGILVNAMHPGVINTKMLISNWGAIGESPQVGAQNVLNTMFAIQNSAYSGMYFVNAKPAKSKTISYNTKLQEKLWQLSLKLCNLNDLKLD